MGSGKLRGFHFLVFSRCRTGKVAIMKEPIAIQIKLRSEAFTIVQTQCSSKEVNVVSRISFVIRPFRSVRIEPGISFERIPYDFYGKVKNNAQDGILLTSNMVDNYHQNLKLIIYNIGENPLTINNGDILGTLSIFARGSQEPQDFQADLSGKVTAQEPEHALVGEQHSDPDGYAIVDEAFAHDGLTLEELLSSLE